MGYAVEGVSIAGLHWIVASSERLGAHRGGGEE